ncbi:MAG: CPBP family intramembrane metalloprotease [Proteobacteria bacterium]|nr:CPBP family intramembrane metalloprotease [Pseudomonadota bacterium]
MMQTSLKQNGFYLSLILAFVLWMVMFVFRPFNFWLMLSFSTALLATISFLLGRPLIRKDELTWRNLFLGILMAGILYAIFWVGNQALIIISHLFPDLLPDRSGNISAVYANLGALSPFLVGLLLFFPIGFGEEIFWRGFIQRRFTREWSGGAAFVLTTLLYTGVHLPTWNPVLILAALTCGLFWGGLYWATGTLVPVLISHMIWDPLIFVIWPIK